MVRKLIPNHFLKNQNWVYLWINSQKFYAVCFYCMPVEGYQNILKLSCRPLAFTLYKAFLKNKKRSGTILPVLLCACLLKKNISRVIFYNWPNFIVYLPLVREMLANMCISIVCWLGCDFTNFEINLIFLIRPFFLRNQNVKTKI